MVNELRSHLGDINFRTIKNKEKELVRLREEIKIFKEKRIKLKISQNLVAKFCSVHIGRSRISNLEMEYANPTVKDVAVLNRALERIVEERLK